MDIVAKHIPADKDGVRIAELDEQSYRYLLWNHRPLTDFWMTGSGTVKRLEAHGIYTMGDLARFSIHGEDRLYEIFGVDAEILIDHAWGYEPCGMAEIKSYKPSTNSISEGQVLTCPYLNDKAKLIVREMAEILMFRLTEKKLVTESITCLLYTSDDLDALVDILESDEVGLTFAKYNTAKPVFVECEMPEGDRQAITDVLNAYYLYLNASEKVRAKALADISYTEVES